MNYNKLYLFSKLFLKSASQIPEERRRVLITEINNIYVIFTNIKQNKNKYFNVWLGVDTRYQKDIDDSFAASREMKTNIEENSDTVIVPGIRSGVDIVKYAVDDLRTCSYLKPEAINAINSVENSITNINTAITD